jgi:vacuolar-type H+-ATPase subunit E/Vma4
MEFESIVEVQLGAMLEGIEEDLAQRRAAILDEARRQARSRLRDARRQAMQRMSLAIAEEKDQWYSSLGRASAALASRLRRKQQELDREQLSAGEQELRSALLTRWDDPEARGEWANALLADAGALLSQGGWRIDYPATLSADEAEKLLGSAGAELVAVDGLQAGFRLQQGDTRFDMSIEGLLAQSEEIAGELLAEIRSLHAEGGDS